MIEKLFEGCENLGWSVSHAANAAKNIGLRR